MNIKIEIYACDWDLIILYLKLKPNQKRLGKICIFITFAIQLEKKYKYYNVVTKIKSSSCKTFFTMQMSL